MFFFYLQTNLPLLVRPVYFTEETDVLGLINVCDTSGFAVSLLRRPTNFLLRRKVRDTPPAFRLRGTRVPRRAKNPPAQRRAIVLTVYITQALRARSNCSPSAE